MPQESTNGTPSVDSSGRKAPTKYKLGMERNAKHEEPKNKQESNQAKTTENQLRKLVTSEKKAGLDPEGSLNRDNYEMESRLDPEGSLNPDNYKMDSRLDPEGYLNPDNYKMDSLASDPDRPSSTVAYKPLIYKENNVLSHALKTRAPLMKSTSYERELSKSGDRQVNNNQRPDPTAHVGTYPDNNPHTMTNTGGIDTIRRQSLSSQESTFEVDSLNNTPVNEDKNSTPSQNPTIETSNDRHITQNSQQNNNQLGTLQLQLIRAAKYLKNALQPKQPNTSISSLAQQTNNASAIKQSNKIEPNEQNDTLNTKPDNSTKYNQENHHECNNLELKPGVIDEASQEDNSDKTANANKLTEVNTENDTHQEINFDGNSGSRPNKSALSNNPHTKSPSANTISNENDADDSNAAGENNSTKKDQKIIERPNNSAHSLPGDGKIYKRYYDPENTRKFDKSQPEHRATNPTRDQGVPPQSSEIEEQSTDGSTYFLEDSFSSNTLVPELNENDSKAPMSPSDIAKFDEFIRGRHNNSLAPNNSIDLKNPTKNTGPSGNEIKADEQLTEIPEDWADVSKPNSSNEPAASTSEPIKKIQENPHVHNDSKNNLSVNEDDSRKSYLPESNDTQAHTPTDSDNFEVSSEHSYNPENTPVQSNPSSKSRDTSSSIKTNKPTDTINPINIVAGAKGVSPTTEGDATPVKKIENFKSIYRVIRSIPSRFRNKLQIEQFGSPAFIEKKTALPNPSQLENTTKAHSQRSNSESPPQDDNSSKKTSRGFPDGTAQTDSLPDVSPAASTIPSTKVNEDLTIRINDVMTNLKIEHPPINEISDPVDAPPVKPKISRNDWLKLSRYVAEAPEGESESRRKEQDAILRLFFFERGEF